MRNNNYTEKQWRELLSQTLEEPEVVRMKVNKTYEIIRADKNNEKRGRARRRRRIAGAAAAAAAVALIAGTPVMAKGIGKAWNTVVAAMFGADEQVQENYGQAGLSQTFETPGQEETGGQRESGSQTKGGTAQKNGAQQALPSETVGGMTVSLQQILTDGYQLYLYLDVEAPEGMTIDTGCVFDGTNLMADGEVYQTTEGNMGMSASFVTDEYAISKNHRGYEVVYYASEGFNLEGMHLGLRMQDFLVDKGKLDMETAIEGVWMLEWDMDAAYHGRTVSIDLAGGYAGEHAALSSIDITPLSYTLYYEYDGSKQQLFDDTLWVAFVMKDGTVLNERGNQDSLITGHGGGRGLTRSRECFAKILDVDQVAGVLIDGVTYPVK